MTKNKMECEHRCRNTCAMLSRILKDERSAVEACDTMIRDCDDPAMIGFARELLKTHSSLEKQIENALSDIKAKAGILDDVIEGLEKQ